MAIEYSGRIIGTFTLCQKKREIIDDKLVEVKDEKGRPVYNKFKIQIRASNCMMCAIHVSKIDNPENPKKCWQHRLVSFFMDERHLKNCKKDRDKDFFKHVFSGELRNIKLNVYYKDMQTLMRYMTQDGLKVQCYYKEPKKKGAYDY